MMTPATGIAPETESTEEREHSLHGAAYLTAVVGIVHALLFFLSIWLLFGTPGGSSITGDAYRRRLTLAGLYLMPFAGIAFIWFIVALRMWTSGHLRRENILLSNVQLVSGILYVAIFFAAGAAAATAAASAEYEKIPVDPVFIDEFPRYASTLLFVFAIRMAAMFVFTTTNIARSANVLPRWFNMIGFVVGLFLMLSATFSRVLVLVFPAWVLVLCILLLLRVRRVRAGVMIPRSAPLSDAAYLGRGGGGNGGGGT
jgi:hypothetical protein